MNSLHSVLLVIITCLAIVSGRTFQCSTRQADTDLADSLWTFSLAHPDGFTLDLGAWTEPSSGIAVSYEATQDSHGRDGLDFVISHAMSHDGYVGGWLNSDDSLFYFDSVRIFPEDSLAAAVSFGEANHQYAIYILSSGEEIRLDGDMGSVPELVPAWN